MSKLYVRSIMITLILIVFVAFNHSELSAQTEMQLGVVKQLKEIDPSIRIQWDEKKTVPTRLAGKLSGRVEGKAEDIALGFFKNNETLFGMVKSEEELKVLKVNKDVRGWEHVSLQQTYKALPVEGKYLMVHINDNKEVRIVDGDYLPKIDLNIAPSIPDSNAIAFARENLNPQKELMQPPEADLVVYARENKAHLVWKTILVSEEPLGEFIYYVDAHTGEVVYSYNNLQFSLNRQTYDSQNSYSIPGTLVRSEGGTASGDVPLDAAHNNAGVVYNFYKNNYGRDSFDNAGASIVSSVHYGVNFNNAGWSSYYQQMIYGDGDGVQFAPLSQALDVVAHELTHAVTSEESGLEYHDQSGALNESISDIFAVLMDPSDWMIGEDVYTPGTPGDALRYMDDPPLGNQPDHMDDFVTPDPNGSAMDQACYAASSQDNNCVHFNSGIPNKAAYLMAEGGTHHDISVLGMGLTNVGKVFYEAQVHWLTPTSDFADAREATLDAVSAIFPGDLSKYNTVMLAWAAVGIGQTPDFTLELKPSPFEVGVGDIDSLTAMVTKNGNPRAGTKVTFASANTSRATVSAGSGITNNDGEVKVAVKGESRGNTIISSNAVHGSDVTSATVQVEVPTTSDIGVAIIIVMLGTLVVITVKRKIPGKMTG